MKHTKLIAWTGTLLAVSLFATSCFSKGRTIPEKAEAVTPFDASRYLGTWYEVARFDFKFERGLSKTTANYTLNEDGSIKVINLGYNAEKGKWKEAEGKAVFIGDPNIAMLKVSFFGPFYTGYNVIAIDPEYKYALVEPRLSVAAVARTYHAAGGHRPVPGHCQGYRLRHLAPALGRAVTGFQSPCCIRHTRCVADVFYPFGPRPAPARHKKPELLLNLRIVIRQATNPNETADRW